MLTSLDITRILAESSPALVDSNIIGLEYYRKERTVQLYFKSDKRYALTLSFHPQRSGFYVLTAGRSRIDTREKYRPFAREVWDGKIIAVTQIPNDRIVEITVENRGRDWILVFEILGPNANLWLLDDRRQIIASLRRKQFTENETYSPPPLPPKLNPNRITIDDLKKLIAQNPDGNPARLMEKNIYGFDYYLASALLPDDDLTDPENLETLLRRLRQVIDAYRSRDGSIYAYYIKGKSRFYPIRVPQFEPLGKYKSVSRAQLEVLSGIKENIETESERDRTLKYIRGRIKKIRRLLKNLDRDIEEAADYERYLQFADLLKINLPKLERGLTGIEVEDLYGGGKTEIPLDPKLNGPENIEAYSRRYRKGKEGLELMIRRRENIGREMESLSEALDEFERDFEAAQNKYPELCPPAPGEPSTPSAPRLPFKEYQTSSGLTIWVGKTEADNDRLTLEYAKPYELWFHASQCPGSHVVMKYPHKNFEPSRLEIEETAMLAAWFSKARKSAKVPVSYTLKKYVRKPRGAKPGLVTIQREKTIMVEPKELDKKDTAG